MSEDSYIKLDSRRVIQLCNQKLGFIEDDRAESHLRWIQRQKDSREFWRKVFPWLKPFTDEEALESAEVNDEYSNPKYDYIHTEARVNDLLRLAAASDEVLLSNSDYQRIL